jgi:hypothetical protein
MKPETTILYRPVGPKELELIAASGYREFPPRLPEQPILRTHIKIGNGRAVFWRAAGKAQRRSIAKRSVTEEQHRQVPARKQPSGLPVFAAAAALLVSRRSIKDILPPRALQQQQISSNAPVPYFDTGSHPVLNEEYARQIACEWNVKASGVGHVTRFALRREFAAKYPVQKVGSSIYQELWIPAEDVKEMNRNIVGMIEVIAEYK